MDGAVGTVGDVGVSGGPTLGVVGVSDGPIVATGGTVGKI